MMTTACHLHALAFLVSLEVMSANSDSVKYFINLNCMLIWLHLKLYTFSSAVKLLITITIITTTITKSHK